MYGERGILIRKGTLKFIRERKNRNFDVYLWEEGASHRRKGGFKAKLRFVRHGGKKGKGEECITER